MAVLALTEGDQGSLKNSGTFKCKAVNLKLLTLHRYPGSFPVKFSFLLIDDIFSSIKKCRLSKYGLVNFMVQSVFINCFLWPEMIQQFLILFNMPHQSLPMDPFKSLDL